MKQPIHSTAAVGRRTPRLDARAGGGRTSKIFEFMASFRIALLATAAREALGNRGMSLLGGRQSCLGLGLVTESIW